MSIQVYDDVILSKNVIRAGASGRMTRANDRSMAPSGYASVNAVRDVTLREYLFGVKPMLLAFWAKVRAIWNITDSGAFGFLIQDPTNPAVTVDLSGLQGYMSGVEFGTVGFGNGCPTYGLRQLEKADGSPRVYAQAVTRLKGTPTIYRGGTPLTVGVAAGNIAISAGPSYVTFVADATRTVSAVTVGATTQVTLNSAIGVVIGGRLWLQGLTGADAALLNNQSHQVTAITGAGLNVYTLSTNTAGKTITAAGQGHKYPQPDESLTWAGEFYVPVQFAEDELNWELVRPGHDDDRLVAGPSTTLIEIREA